MADFISPIVDILTRLWDCCSTRVESIRKLQENLDSLRNASEQLRSKYLDVKTKVETAEQDPDLKVLNEVTHWMRKVEASENEVQVILQQGHEEAQTKCFGGRCPKRCRATYKFQKVVTKKLAEVQELISKGHFDVVAHKFAHAVFDELPMEDKAVGLESSFDELCACFQDDKVGVIGLYGMGGVGKTTLLKKFNNEFLPTRTHDVVIWVVVSKEVDLGKIQEVIRNKFHIEHDIWNNKTVDERAIMLHRKLTKKKFVLLLDDLWGRIDLSKLGIPLRSCCGSKIVFTTRSEEVCSHMEAHKRIKLQCLTPKKAFELFQEKVGESTLDSHPDIPHLAKIVVDECKGLPLALCTVGRSMANKVTPKEWKRALEILKGYPSRFSGMVDYVYHLLEFSYDRLPNAVHMSCFLYCSLFPEDHNIDKEGLILLWIGEGFLAEFDDDIHEARKQGEDIISNLMYSCLLENGDNEYTVKMHDVVRDMALWVACDHGANTKFLVRDGVGNSAIEVSSRAKWKEVERLSVWGSGTSIQYFSTKPYLPHLSTMLMINTKVEVFPTEAFLLTNAVRVLELSGNMELRNIPAKIGIFENLEYLNLSDTGIEELPDELKNLKNLRCLLLGGMYSLTTFPKGVISSLLSLQAFSMLGHSLVYDDENALLHELESLEHLQDIKISLSVPSFVQKVFMYPKLQRCILRLHLIGDWDSPLQISYSSLRRMEQLETLTISGRGPSLFIMEDEKLRGIEAENIPGSTFQGHEYIINIRSITILYCEMFDLNWLRHAPNLEILSLDRCYSLEEVMSDSFGDADTERVKRDLFSSLTILHLRGLYKLRSICRLALQFPCLKEIQVIECPNLMKLPFDSQSTLKNLKRIMGQRSWWNRLRWEDEVIKDLLNSRFQAHY